MFGILLSCQVQTSLYTGLGQSPPVIAYPEVSDGKSKKWSHLDRSLAVQTKQLLLTWNENVIASQQNVLFKTRMDGSTEEGRNSGYLLYSFFFVSSSVIYLLLLLVWQEGDIEWLTGGILQSHNRVCTVCLVLRLPPGWSRYSFSPVISLPSFGWLPFLMFHFCLTLSGCLEMGWLKGFLLDWRKAQNMTLTPLQSHIFNNRLLSLMPYWLKKIN